MREFNSSPYWLFFYSFFIVSFIPYFIIRFSDSRWVYEILYRPNGIVENMTVLLYCIAVALSGWMIFKVRQYDLTLLGVFALGVFMIGEEVRWGLSLFVDDIHEFYLTSVQDILVYSVLGIPERFPLYLVAIMFFIRVLLSCALCALIVAGWYYRHSFTQLKSRVDRYPFSGYFFVYGLLMFGVIILELFIQPGPRKLDYIEETFELNAALLLVLIGHGRTIPLSLKR